MRKAVALIDGEHYPPVVRFALDALASEVTVVAAVFLGGTEKVDLERGLDTYGVPVITAPHPADALRKAVELHSPDELVDLSDEPVVSSADRFRLASLALSLGVDYRGADFMFTAPVDRVSTQTPTLGIIGTGKRVGKTALSAYVARRLKQSGLDIVVLAMGRGGPAEPELIRGELIELTTPHLLELARQGKHASSDNYEDAVMSRVTTVGCRRCGGGMAGETFFSNVPEGAELADSLGKELLVLEGSGSAIPPVFSDASILVIGAGRGAGYVSDYFGPYRLSRADLVVVTSAEEPVASAQDVELIRTRIASIAPDVTVVATTLRPVPLQPIDGKRVLFATTAPSSIAGKLGQYLADEYGAHVVGVSTNLSNRSLLRADIARYAGQFDTLVTELKAAAIDVVAAAGQEAGVPTVLCDNVPVALDGHDLGHLVERVARIAIERGQQRADGSGNA